MESKSPVSAQLIQGNIENIAYKLQKEKFILSENIDEFIARRTVQPLNEFSIITYLQAHPHYQETWLSYLGKHPGLEGLCHNPLFLIWLREYFVDYSILPAAENIYRWLFQKWFQCQHDRLEKVGLLKNYKGDFIEHCWVYTRAVCLKLKEVRSDGISFDEDPFVEESLMTAWERFFGTEAPTNLIWQSYPWQICEERRLSLYHPDIINYFAQLTDYDFRKYLYLSFIHGDEEVEQLSQLLNREVFAVDSNQLSHLVADILVSDISKEDYFRLIYLSAVNERFARIAANAITILNGARIPLSGKDFRNIQIPDADLSHALLSGSTFMGADLTRVRFDQAHLAYADFSRAKLEGANFGLLPLLEHGDSVIALSYAKKGKYLATGCQHGTISLWNMSRGIKKSSQSHSTWTCAVFNQAGSKLASADKSIMGKIQLFCVKKVISSEINAYLHIHEIFTLAFRPNHQQLISADESIVVLWDVANNQVMEVLGPDPSQQCKGGKVTALAFSPDGNKLAVAYEKYDQGTVLLWQLTSSGNPSSEELQVSKTRIHVITFSSLYHYVAIGHSLGIELLNINTGKMVKIRTLPVEKIVTTLTFSSDSQRLASGSRGRREIQIWDVSSGKILNTVSRTDGVNVVIFSPDDRYLASTGWDGKVRIWDISNVQLQQIQHSEEKVTVIFSPDGTQLVVGNDKSDIQLYDAITGQVLNIFKCDCQLVIAFAFSPDGRWLAVVGPDTVQLWDTFNEYARVTFSNPCGKEGRIAAAAFSFDSQSFALISGNKLQVWDMANLPNPKLKFARGYDATIKLFTLIFNHDCSCIALGYAGNKVILCDAVNGEILKEFETRTGGSASTLSFSSDDSYLAVGRAFGALVHLRYMHTGGYTELWGHTIAATNITVVVFHPKRHLLASGDDGGNVIIWDLATEYCLAKLPHAGRPISAIHWNVAGNQLHIVDDYRQIFVWCIPESINKRYTLMRADSTGSSLTCVGLQLEETNMSPGNRASLRQLEASTRYGLFTHHDEKNIDAQMQFEDWLQGHHFMAGNTIGEGNCFLEACLQVLNRLVYTEQRQTTASLKRSCHTYIVKLLNDSNECEAVIESVNEKFEQGDWNQYITNLHQLVNKTINNDPISLMLSQPYTEAKIISNVFEIKIHILEIADENNKNVLEHQLINGNEFTSLKYQVLENIKTQIIHLATFKNYFVPLLAISQQIVTKSHVSLSSMLRSNHFDSPVFQKERESDMSSLIRTSQNVSYEHCSKQSF